MSKTIRVFAPASVTNVGCGFDIMGFSLDWPGDELILQIKEKPGITISKIVNADDKIPLDPEKNTAGVAIKRMMDSINYDKGVDLKIIKHMGLGSGMGSSAASAVAGAYALNEILGRPFNKSELFPFAVEGEKLTCGDSLHVDNVAACLYGGFIIVRSANPFDIVELDYPEDLHCTVIHPHIELHTSEMRKILKMEIPLRDAVVQWGNIASLVTGLMKKDYDLISRSLNDVIVEPIRSQVIPGYPEIKSAALKVGALGCSISGSGPSIFALSSVEKTAKKIGDAMKREFDKLQIESDLFISKINKNGPRVID